MLKNNKKLDIMQYSRTCKIMGFGVQMVWIQIPDSFLDYVVLDNSLNLSSCFLLHKMKIILFLIQKILKNEKKTAFVRFSVQLLCHNKHLVNNSYYCLGLLSFRDIWVNDETWGINYVIMKVLIITMSLGLFLWGFLWNEKNRSKGKSFGMEEWGRNSPYED